MTATDRVAFPASRIRDGEMKSVVLEGEPWLVLRLEGTLHAYRDRCAHRGVPLSCGRLRDGVLTCSAHEWTYEARTGRGINPDSVALEEVPVREDRGLVILTVGEPGDGRTGERRP